MNFPPNICRTLLALALSGCAALSVGAQPTLQPVEKLGKAADNKIYAQQLVNELMAANPDLLSAGLHAMPLTGTDYVTVAQTKDIIGRKSSEDDLAMITQDEIRIRPDMSGDTPRIKTNAPLRDQSGHIIGLVALSFKRGPGITALTVHMRVDKILSELSAKIPNRAALFNPIR